MKKNIVIIILSILTASILAFGSWFVVQAYGGNISIGWLNSLLPKYEITRKEEPEKNTASNDRNADKKGVKNPASTDKAGEDIPFKDENHDGKAEAPMKERAAKLPTSNGICMLSNDGNVDPSGYSPAPTHYTCNAYLDARVQSDNDKNPDTANNADKKAGERVKAEPDYQQIINDVKQYKKLPDISDCAANYNYNVNRMVIEDYEKCSLGWYKDGSGNIMLLATDENMQPVSVIQNMKLKDDGNADTVDMYGATMLSMVGRLGSHEFDMTKPADYGKKMSDKSVYAISRFMKKNDYDVRKAENSAGYTGTGVYINTRDNEKCILAANEYDEFVHELDGYTVNMTDDKAWLTICTPLTDKDTVITNAGKSSDKSSSTSESASTGSSSR